MEGGNKGREGRREGGRGGSDDAMQGESISGGLKEGGLMKGTCEEGTERGMDGARERGEGGSEWRRD